MKNIVNLFSLLTILFSLLLLNSCVVDKSESAVGLTLIPPASITNQVNLDIRGGIKTLLKR